VVDIRVSAQHVMPFVTAAATAYGSAVVQNVSDAAADTREEATVRVGRQMLRRLFASGQGDQVHTAVVRPAEAPEDYTSAATGAR
jgi:hypothetical protein